MQSISHIVQSIAQLSQSVWEYGAKSCHLCWNMITLVEWWRIWTSQTSSLIGQKVSNSPFQPIRFRVLFVAPKQPNEANGYWSLCAAILANWLACRESSCRVKWRFWYHPGWAQGWWALRRSRVLTLKEDSLPSPKKRKKRCQELKENEGRCKTEEGIWTSIR